MPTKSEQRPQNAAHGEREGLWDVERLADYLSLSTTQVRRLARQAVLPYVRIGTRILFKPASIERFLDQREQGGYLPARRGRRPNA
jgi:excisionase family DNA binding protein